MTTHMETVLWQSIYLTFLSPEHRGISAHSSAHVDKQRLIQTVQCRPKGTGQEAEESSAKIQVKNLSHYELPTIGCPLQEDRRESNEPGICAKDPYLYNP